MLVRGELGCSTPAGMLGVVRWDWEEAGQGMFMVFLQTGRLFDTLKLL